MPVLLAAILPLIETALHIPPVPIAPEFSCGGAKSIAVHYAPLFHKYFKLQVHQGLGLPARTSVHTPGVRFPPKTVGNAYAWNMDL